MHIDQNKISYPTILPTSRTALALVRTHDLHCVRSHCVFKHIDIHLERLLNETGQSRSRSPGNGQWAKIVGPKYAGKCSNFQLAGTHTHQETFMYVYSGLSYEISQIINCKSSWHIIVIVIVAGLPRFSELAKLGLPVKNRS